jgi:hypothetical protein
MKFFRIDLLTLLISLFILNSCKNQDTIGLGVNAASAINGSLVVDTPTITTVTDDTVVTSGIAKTPLGYFKDPVFGISQSDLITDLNLPASGPYTVPTGTVYIDSAVLILKYADGFYGDSLSSKYKVNVYQLNEKVYSGNSYYNNRIWSYNNQNLIGSKSFFSRTHDSLKVYDLVEGGPDTLIKVAPQVRVPIDTNFIRRILFNASTTQLSSNLIFNNNVKGLYISMDKNQAGPGGTFMIASPGDSSIAIYYRTISGTTIDTVLTYLDVNMHAAYITHTYSQQVTNALNHQEDTTIYLQGLASLRAKISFPNIQNLFKSVGGSSNVIINRAEVVLTPVPGSDIPSYLVPQPKLTLYRYDDAHQRISVEDASATDPRAYTLDVFGGFYGPLSKNYHFLVTSYLQDLITNKTIDYGTYIAPIDTTNTSGVDIAATPQTAGRTEAVGNSKTSPYGIRLNVIYTKINPSLK